MKTAIPLLALAISTAVPALLATDDETAQARNAHYKELQKQIADYYNIDSPWRGANIELEGTLLHLMAAEVGIWQLCDNLKRRNDEENYSIASSVGTPLHEEVLSVASNAVSVFRTHPNQRLLKLLVTHLEAYPARWSEEGYEDLLPKLRKLLQAKPK